MPWTGGQTGIGNNGAGARIWKIENFLLALCQGPVARDQNLMLARQMAPVQWGWGLRPATEALRGINSIPTLTPGVDPPEDDLPAFLAW